MNEKEVVYAAGSEALKIKGLGNNCAQACLGALAPWLELELAGALKMTAALGGGMKHGQLCGALLGAGVALGLEFGSGTLKKSEEEIRGAERLETLTVELVDRFREKLGTTVCEKLLEGDTGPFQWEMPADMDYVKTPEDQEGYGFNLKKPVCGRAVTHSTEIALDIILRERRK